MRAALILLTSLLLASPAAALTITSAKVDHGAVQVKGKDAVPSASITWEGVVVATASKSGAFRFATAALPSDCTGDVGDGTGITSIAVRGCTAKPGLALVVTDANGRAIGPYVVDPLGEFNADAVGLASPDGAILAPFYNQGFDTSPHALFFASTDCAGAPLLPTQPGVLIRAGNVVDGSLYYPRRDGTTVTLRSDESRRDALSCSAPGNVFTPPDRCCCTGPDCLTAFTTDAAAPGTVDLGALVPPFHVELR